MTLRQACVKAGAWLKANGVEDGRSHAERLLLHVLEMDRAALLLAWNEFLPPGKGEEWQALVCRRATGEPLQYVIGEEWFYSRPFAVTPAVLIPRPETELLVEGVLAAAERLWPAALVGGLPESAGSNGAQGLPESAGSPEAGELPGPIGNSGARAAAPTVVDVGTGSGAIAVTLAAQRHDWRVSASDLSPDALEVARANAARHGAADRVTFVQGDLLAPFIASGSRIDVLVSNPPYIPAADMDGLQREVRDYEPHLALVGGMDGLDPYRRMLEQLALLPAMPRIVAFELGIHQPRIVAGLMRKMGAWDDVSIITDYNGIERHIVAVNTGG
ncbi:peptide chain release factor N(5)-glutamine methyltransferase [Paenibacillus sp. PAMC21692]|nr:peptide chain release factor N(5)-glutamine methyltransferase [Paenibacillus sp. PAMC21692]